MFKKENRLNLILASLVTLLPMAVGLIFWNSLPDLVPRHWDLSGNADGYSGKGLVVFGLPLIMLAAHWLCIGLSALDKRNSHQNPKMLRLVLWIIPVLTNILAIFFVITLSGREPAMGIMILFFALLFIVLGNYMPKCSRNYTMGIKVKWTLADSENWAATHRFAGKVWVLCGLVMLFCMLLEKNMLLWVFFPVLIVAMGAPTLYSYLYYRKHGDQ